MGSYCSISPSSSTLGFDIMFQLIGEERNIYNQNDKGEGKDIAERCPLRL